MICSAVLGCRKKIENVCTDNRSEFVKKKTAAVLKKYKIRQELTVTPSPQTNGMADIVNYSIYDRVMWILVETQLPGSLWAELSAGFVYVLKRCPRGTTEEIPLNKLYRQGITLKPVPFGCLEVGHTRTSNKLLPRSSEFYMLGYNDNSISQHMWLPWDNCIKTFGDDKIFENILYKDHRKDVNNVEITLIAEPLSFKEVLNIDDDKSLADWFPEMQLEHEVLQKSKFFEIVKRRDDLCILPSHWVLTKKISATLTKLKMGFVMKGCA
jgi:hypothetical protein